MASLINFSGIASGIDSSSLIKALLDQQRQVRVKPLQTKISELTDTNDAFGTLSTKLGTLKSSLEGFRALHGGALSKESSSSDEGVVSAVASTAARAGTYSLSVNKLAKNATLSFDDRFSSGSSVIAGSIDDLASPEDRSVTISVGSGSSKEDVAVELTSTTTVDEFVSKFNATSTKATASAVNVGTASVPSYAVVISSNDTGLDQGQLTVSNGAAVGASTAFAAQTTSQAQNAEFSVSGIAGTITRGNNTISDVITGLTFNLQSEGAATVTVKNDADTTKQKVKDFVEAYNEVIKYVSENNAVTREEDGGEVRNIFGSLSQSSLDDNLLTSLRTDLSSTSNSSGAVRIFADLGITTQRDGTLAVDDDKLTDALATDASGVQSLLEQFAEKTSSVDGTISQYTRYNGLLGQAQQANSNEISSSQKQVAEIEKQLTQYQESLVQRYARLESLIGSLNSQQSALSGLLR